MAEVNADKAGRTYWDDLWREGPIPRAVDPRKRGLWYHIHRRFDRFYREVLPEQTRGKKLLEIGSARSAWLPYFALEFGFQVTGLDYSARGAEQCRQVLINEGVTGDVICADFRSPPASMLNAFDVVTSYGVIEHFANSAGALKDAASFLRPGGLLITVIPNMHGLVGWLQRAWNRQVYDVHVRLDRSALIEAHVTAGLLVERCDYTIVLPFGVVNLQGLPDTGTTGLLRFLHYWLQVGSALLWWLDERAPVIRPNAACAGYVICAATRPAHPTEVMVHASGRPQ